MTIHNKIYMVIMLLSAVDSTVKIPYHFINTVTFRSSRYPSLFSVVV